MRRALLAGMALLGACDRNSPGVDDDKVNTQMLERVAVQRNETVDAGVSARLEPLPSTGVPAGGAACAFFRDGRILVAARGVAARARIAGAIRDFRAAGPVGRDGGFWRDRELAISIAREPAGAMRARVTNRLTEAQEDHVGQWQCRP
ncbi:MAG: hypothetical protein AB7H79_10750 [Sphingomonas sp.]